VVNLNSSALAVTNKIAPQLWHQRLGHPSDHELSFLNLSLDSSSCDSCHYAKQHKLSFGERFEKANKLFDLVHSDIWGNAPVESRNGFKYFIMFIDDKSRTTWLYLFKSKSEVCMIF
jgi:GAG-pre-integrase domain